MRLICPNCGAQYEVGDDVIPPTGRDVQCSNCSHTWFQRSANQNLDLGDQPDAAPPQDKADHLPEEQHAAAAEADSDHLPEDEYEEEADGPLERELTRRQLDPSITGILREEAEREQAEREEEHAGLETQTELGLDSGTDLPPEPDTAAIAGAEPETADDSDDVESDDKRHEEDLTAPDEPTFTEAPQDDQDDITISAVMAGSTRRDLLPDIEEINSTLTATSDREETDPEDREDQRARSGFRRGFILAVLVFVILALLYIYAPRIADAVPATEPALSSYVDAVNGLRQWLDGLMQRAVEKLTALLSQVSASEAA